MIIKRRTRLAGFVIFFALNIAASISNAEPLFSIPVRLGLSAGYSQSAIEFKTERENEELKNFAVGLDFNLPILPLSAVLGVTGWYTPKTSSRGNSESSLLILAAYLGYANERNIYLLDRASVHL